VNPDAQQRAGTDARREQDALRMAGQGHLYAAGTDGQDENLSANQGASPNHLVELRAERLDGQSHHYAGVPRAARLPPAPRGIPASSWGRSRRPRHCSGLADVCLPLAAMQI
jgi:hypothetical protein